MRKRIYRILFISVIFCIMLFIRSVVVEATPKNNNPILKDLTLNVGELNPIFNSSVIDYSVVVPENTNKIEVKAIPDDLNATVEIVGDTELRKGLNIIKVNVTAENEINKRTYTINVTRGNAEKSNVNLKKIEIANYLITPSFSNDVTDYFVEIKDSDESLNFNIEPEDSSATVEIIGNENLTKRSNAIVIKVTAPDSITTKLYKVIATKQNGAVTSASDAWENIINEITDESLTTTDYDGAFNENVKMDTLIKLIGIFAIVIIFSIIIIIIVKKNKKEA